jgi:hypothetical protein
MSERFGWLFLTIVIIGIVLICVYANILIGENYRLKEQLAFNQAKLDSLRLGCNKHYIVWTDSLGLNVCEVKKK